MSAEWVAGGVRSRALLRRRLGRAGARRLAGCTSLEEGLHLLVSGPYQHDVRIGQSLAQAQHAVGATLLWHLRVLAGWQPRAGAAQVRLLAGAFEVANVAERVRAIGGGDSGQCYHLGALSTAWSQLGAADSLADLRAALAASPWGDPGADRPWAVLVGMRLGLARRVTAGVDQAAAAALGWAALMVARERYLLGRTWPQPLLGKASTLFGVDLADCPTLPAFAAALPAEAGWTLSGVDGAESLWQAEGRWWARVERDGAALLRSPGFGPDRVVGCVALLAVDARRVVAALEAAARGGAAREVFDAVA